MKLFMKKIKKKALEACNEERKIEDKRKQENVDLLEETLESLIIEKIEESIAKSHNNKKAFCSYKIDIRIKDDDEFYFDVNIPKERTYYFESLFEIQVFFKEFVSEKFDIKDAYSYVDENGLFWIDGAVAASVKLSFTINLEDY